MSNWDSDVDGPGVIRSVDPLVRAIEAMSAEEVLLFVIALARSQRAEETLDPGKTP